MSNNIKKELLSLMQKAVKLEVEKNGNEASFPFFSTSSFTAFCIKLNNSFLILLLITFHLLSSYFSQC